MSPSSEKDNKFVIHKHFISQATDTYLFGYHLSSQVFGSEIEMSLCGLSAGYKCHDNSQSQKVE